MAHHGTATDPRHRRCPISGATRTRVSLMNDTDKLIAAIFAATMTAKETTPKASDFFGFYDACIAEILEREALDTAMKVEIKLAAQIKAWGQTQ
jgi:hypothetical protein